MGSHLNEGKFKCTLKLQRKDDGGRVFFKLDGNRFKTAPETLKLKPSTEYLLTLEFQPVTELLAVNIAGINYTFELVNDPEKDFKSKYQLTWSTFGIEPTVNRCRADVHFSLNFRNSKVLDFKIQAKFYPTSDTTHITWGQELHFISLECTAGKNGSVSTIDKVKYQ